MGLHEISILFVTLLVFGAGVMVSQIAHAPDSYPRLLEACLRTPVDQHVCRTTINAAHEGGHTFAHYDLLGILAETLKAIAIAVAVAVGVAGILDARNRDKLNTELTAKAQLIGINVFDALFANNHSLELLEKIKRDILYKPVVREMMSVNYVLTNYEGKNRLAGRCFTIVTASVNCTFTNIATVAGSTAHLPLEVSLPNPLLNELKKMTGLVSAKVKWENQPDVEFSAAQITAANEILHVALDDDSAPEGIVSFGDLTLHAGESGGFEVTYRMIKEAEDSELLRSFHTTNAISLTVVDNTGRNLHVRAKAIHSSSLNALMATGTMSQWELREIIFPQQGVMVWWKEHPKPVVRQRRMPLEASKSPPPG